MTAAEEQESKELHIRACKSFKLRLFCSIDMTGSTAFKYRHQPWDGESEWPKVIESFIEDVPLEVAKASQTQEIPDSLQLRVWKMLGDEVLFQTTLTSYSDVVRHLSAVKTAMTIYSQSLKERDFSLGLKGTAWVAGFPVTNREVEIGDQTDYVGPAIDLGFRLAGHSTQRKFIVDCGIAMMLIQAREAERLDLHPLFFDGCESLKGVGAPYPLLWMSMANSQAECEDKLRQQQREPAEWLELRDYLRDYYERARTVKQPFIVNDEGAATFGEIDPEILEAAKRELSGPTEVSWKEQPEVDDGGNVTKHQTGTSLDDLSNALKNIVLQGIARSQSMGKSSDSSNANGSTIDHDAEPDDSRPE